ncbi:MAG: AAA family ATPase [Bacteroidia bacterium]|nr:AAA family ATPase [Bacteroidia bacterium]
MSRFRYPVDTDQFAEIREQGMMYVDKTGLMFDLISKYKYVFLARPRRFGKSLLCNTLKAYFQGEKELFVGLKVMELEKEWRRYPVLHFSMSGLKNVTTHEAKTKLESLIRGYEAIYGKEPLSETPGDRFRDLIHNAAKQANEKVVVILDEYDAAIMRLMYEKEELTAMRNMLREFYQVLKDEGAYLRFVFITGVTKFTQVSIFSELNNLKQISMLDDYSGLCGITQEELDTTLRPCVEEYACNIGITTDEAYTLLKKNYDGYHFSPNGADVYAPFSLLRALDDRSTNYYWFESSTTTALIDHLRHYPSFNPLDFDGVVLSQGAFDAPCENAKTPLPLLYQSGYLTIDSYNALLKTYTLHFPNLEVRQGMVEGLSNYLMDTDDLDRDSTIINMAQAIYDGDLAAALKLLRSYIATIPYDIITKKEWMAKKNHEAFYKLLMYVIFSLLNSKVDTEVKSVLGRADVVIQTKADVFVLELKVDKTIDDAMTQIDDKGYAIPYEADGRRVTKCGITISSEARNITHWRMVDAGGNIVDEQKF